MAFDGIIEVGTKIDTGGFDAGVDKMTRSVKRLAVLLAVIFGAKTLTEAAKGVIDIASEYERLGLAAQAVGQMFGFTTTQVTGLVNETIGLGIQADVANRAFVQLARNGLDANLLPALARGAQDLAVFNRNGETSSDTLDRITHGILTLNPVLLRHANVIVDLQGAYARWARENGTTAVAMTAQQKQAVALVEVMKQLETVSGLYELSQTTLAGQMQSNTRIMNDFRAAIGAPFTGALFTIVKAVNGLVKGFTVAVQAGGRLHGVFTTLAAAAQIVAQAIANVIRAIGALFGIEIDFATKAIGDVGAAVGGVADSSEDAAAGQDAVGKATKKAAKEAKGALAAFDELNVLQQKQDTSGAGGGGAGGGGIDAGPVIEPFQKVGQVIDQVKDKVEELKRRLAEFFKPLKEPFERLKTAILELGGKIWDGLKWAWENILKPVGIWAKDQLLPKLFNLAAAAIEAFNTALDILKPLGLWLWENFLKPLGEWAGEQIIELIGWLTEKFEELSDWMKENRDVVEAIAIVLISFGLAILFVVGIVAIAGALLLIFGAIFAIITSPIFLVVAAIAALIAIVIFLIKNWDLVKIGAEATWKKIAAMWGPVGEWFRTKVVEPIKKWFAGQWKEIQDAAKKTRDWVNYQWREAGEWFRTKVNDPIRKWFKGQWDEIKSKAQEARNWVNSQWASAGEWFRTKVTDPVKGFFTSSWNAINTKVSGIRSSVNATWTTAASWFKTRVTDPVKNFFNTSWDAIKTKIGNVWTAVKGVWDDAENWFRTKVINPIGSAFDTTLNTIAEAFTTKFGDIKTTVIGALNTIIDKLNAMINGAVGAINGLIGKINAVKVTIPALLGGGTIGFNISKVVVPPNIPKLATGAVIPPNAAFLAMLGDQRAGRNIEAPENLLRQIVREEIGTMETSVTVRFEGRLAALVRELKPIIDAENSRVGKSLIKSGTVV